MQIRPNSGSPLHNVWLWRTTLTKWCVQYMGLPDSPHNWISSDPSSQCGIPSHFRPWGRHWPLRQANKVLSFLQSIQIQISLLVYIFKFSISLLKTFYYFFTITEIIIVIIIIIMVSLIFNYQHHFYHHKHLIIIIIITSFFVFIIITLALTLL